MQIYKLSKFRSSDNSRCG